VLLGDKIDFGGGQNRVCTKEVRTTTGDGGRGHVPETRFHPPLLQVETILDLNGMDQMVSGISI